MTTEDSRQGQRLRKHVYTGPKKKMIDLRDLKRITAETQVTMKKDKYSIPYGVILKKEDAKERIIKQ